MVPSKFAAAAEPSNAVAELRAAGVHVELIDDPADVRVAAFSQLTDRRARELAQRARRARDPERGVRGHQHDR